MTKKGTFVRKNKVGTTPTKGKLRRNREGSRISRIGAMLMVRKINLECDRDFNAIRPHNVVVGYI